MLDEVLTRLELRLEDLDQEVIQAQNVSTIPFKQHRLILKTQKRKLSERRHNSFSKKDKVATFMCVKKN